MISFVMKDVTSVLNQGSLNKAFKNSQLQNLLYQELRVIAKSKISKNNKNNTINTTALVHDAFIKINNSSKEKMWHNRRHFYATAAMVMQQILTDAARRKMAEKRGGISDDVTFDENSSSKDDEFSEIIALSDAMTQLATVSPELVELVNLRYFAGFSMTEIADLTNTSKRSLDRQWVKARVLLQMWL